MVNINGEIAGCRVWRNGKFIQGKLFIKFTAQNCSTVIGRTPGLCSLFKIYQGVLSYIIIKETMEVCTTNPFIVYVWAGTGINNRIPPARIINAR